MNHLEEQDELLRIDRPVDAVYEAGAIADLLVKNDGPAVLFEQPRLADGTISSIPLLMNALGATIEPYEFSEQAMKRRLAIAWSQ